MLFELNHQLMGLYPRRNGRVRGMTLPPSPPLRTVLVNFSTYGSSLSFRPCDRARLSYEDMLAVNLLVAVWMEQHTIFCPI
jgi:hypothetical protein